MKETSRIGKNETEIEYEITKIEHRRFVRYVKAIPGWLHHALLIADIDKRRIRKVMKIHVLREERYVC